MNAHLVQVYKHVIELESQIKFIRELSLAPECWQTLDELDVHLKNCLWPLRNAIQATLPVDKLIKL